MSFGDPLSQRAETRLQTLCLVALMVFGVIWGPLGMLLATPLTAVARLLLDRLYFTRPLADLLAGREYRGDAAE